MKIVVYHTYYGCESGCCGHVIEVDGKQSGEFHWSHPCDEDPRKFAEDLIRSELGEEHVKDLDWENCRILDDP